MIGHEFPVTVKACFLPAWAAIFIVFTVCSGSHHVKEDELISLQLIYRYPVNVITDSMGKRTGYLDDTITISYYRDLVLYRLPGTRDWETNAPIKGTEPIFIFKKGAKYGLLARSATDSGEGLKKEIDSFLVKRALKGLQILKADSSLRLTANVKDSASGNVIERYGSLSRREETRPDSVYYCYTAHLKKIEYSFSRELDSLRGMKLYKVQLIFNEYLSPSHELIYPKREMFWEMRETPSGETTGLKELMIRVSNKL